MLKILPINARCSWLLSNKILITIPQDTYKPTKILHAALCIAPTVRMLTIMNPTIDKGRRKELFATWINSWRTHIHVPFWSIHSLGVPDYD